MADDPVKSHDGWGWPTSATKPHYFKDARSLCRRWVQVGLGGGRVQIEANADSPSSSTDCLPCTRKLAKLKERGGV